MTQASAVQDPVVIATAARTPMGGFQGVFTNISAVELGSYAIRESLLRAGLLKPDAAATNTSAIDELIFGCVLPAGLGQAPARQAAIKAGLAHSTSCTTINKVCGSGMKATFMAHDQITAGNCDIAIAGGMESMSNAPYLLPKARAGMRLGHSETKDHLFLDGLEDAYTARLMGSFAQQLADRTGLTRKDMDTYAIESLARANNAIAQGYFKAEITPVTVRTRAGESQVFDDEQPGKAKPEKIPQLKPAFSAVGTVTAANSSSISDGAAALLLMRESEAIARGIEPLARIVAHASHAQHPSEFAIAPVEAINKVLAKSRWAHTDVDLFEINEAFAMVALHAIHQLQLDHSKVNVHGGACALGHPLGASGARIIVTLIYALRRLKQRRGVASLCIGGGEATALAIELIS